MPTTNRITIVPVDGAVHTDQGVYIGLDLSTCGIPDDVHAFQYLNGKGEIETKSFGPNIPVTELPNWVVNCLAKWDEADSAQ
jgi:hypothetical protein